MQEQEQHGLCHQLKVIRVTSMHICARSKLVLSNSKRNDEEFKVLTYLISTFEQASTFSASSLFYCHGPFVAKFGAALAGSCPARTSARIIGRP
jgi:hypothetical protein